MHVIGIDPGTATGYAVHDPASGLFVVESGTHYAIMQCVLNRHRNGEVLVVIEDAGLARVGRWAKTYGQVNRLQGVGSVKRDCKLWFEFLKAEKIPYVTVKPKRRATKKDAALFARITGWKGRTNEHGRDAAMFVHGITESMARALLAEAQRKAA
jgi:hypothetical protein